MTRPDDIDPAPRAGVPPPDGSDHVIGAVDRVLIIVGTRTVVTDQDFIRVRDRDLNGKLISDIGYSPAKALAMGQLLVRLALERDPSLRDLRVMDGKTIIPEERR